VRDAAGVPVDQVLIGSCTNSSFRDLMTVAAMLRGRRAHPDVSLGVAAGSRQVFRMIADNGALKDLIDAGARILETACGFCVGFGQSPRSGAVSVRTNNRNFEGRSGTKNAKVYLTSPETAAASALTGRLTDPRDLGVACPEIAVPQRFYVNDDLIIMPGDSAEPIFRGPNIGEPVKKPPLPGTLRVRVAAKVGDKITTDHILPSGPVGKYRSNVAKSSEYLFRDVDPRFLGRCRDHRAEGIGSAIVAGLSYGQGSSREHAALCPMYVGVRLVVAKGIERIHMANLANFGVLPLMFEDGKDYDRLENSDELLVADTKGLLQSPVVRIRNVTRNYEFAASHRLTKRQIENILG
jgi:aconitate hydratase